MSKSSKRSVVCVAGLVLVLTALMFGCSKRGTPAQGGNTSQVSSALQALLSQPSGDGFVIFEENTTRKFVQFAGSAAEPLLLDLPMQTLSPDEFARARQLFASLAGARESSTGFNLDFGRDVKQAASVAMRVFREVYQFQEEMELTVTVR